MSGCLDGGRLAAAASGEDDAARAHAAGCARCNAELVAQQAMARALAALPRGTAPLGAEARRSLKDAILVAGMAAPRIRTRASVQRRRWRAGGMLATVAAAVALWSIARPTPDARPDATIAVAPTPSPAPTVAAAPAVAPAPAATVGARIRPVGKAALRLERVGARDLVHLSEGAIAIDAADQGTPVEVVGGNGRIVVTAGAAEVRAHRGVVASVRVFAGAADIDLGGQRAHIVAGELWVAPETPGAAAAPDAARGRASSMASFRNGWVALRDQRFAEAIRLFDRATDGAVREDAAFWAAVALERAGQARAAADRFERFLAGFPTSPRVGAAHLALATLLASDAPRAARAHLGAAAADDDPRVQAAARARLEGTPAP